MTEKKINVNIGKLRIIVDRWKEADIPGNNIDLNKLADYTLKIINNEPFIKDICNAFFCSISILAIKDPNFDIDTYINVENLDKDEDKRGVKPDKKTLLSRR